MWEKMEKIIIKINCNYLNVVVMYSDWFDLIYML